MINKQFGRWTVIASAPSRKTGTSVEKCFLCRCACGNERITSGRLLRSGKSQSCGCYHSDLAREQGKKKIKHGHSSIGKITQIYRAWLNMNTRCNNPNDPAYKNYGARGITVCTHWRNFEKFLMDMGEPPTPKHTLDRINGTKGYSKINCRWATPKEQANNKRTNHVLKFNGQSKTIAQWAECLGINKGTLHDRVTKLGWSNKEALTWAPWKRNRIYPLP